MAITITGGPMGQGATMEMCLGAWEFPWDWRKWAREIGNELKSQRWIGNASIWRVSTILGHYFSNKSPSYFSLH